VRAQLANGFLAPATTRCREEVKTAFKKKMGERIQLLTYSILTAATIDN
jgi:hypothetical protein